MDEIMNEILQEVYEIGLDYETEACETPGGLEHMGDVRRLFIRWKRKLEECRKVEEN